MSSPDPSAEQSPDRPRPVALRPVVQETHLGADYTTAEVEFLMAMDRYKRERGRPFPTWPEVLAVAKSLGYRRVADARPDFP